MSCLIQSLCIFWGGKIIKHKRGSCEIRIRKLCVWSFTAEDCRTAVRCRLRTGTSISSAGRCCVTRIEVEGVPQGPEGCLKGSKVFRIPFWFVCSPVPLFLGGRVVRSRTRYVGILICFFLFTSIHSLFFFSFLCLNSLTSYRRICISLYSIGWRIRTGAVR